MTVTALHPTYARVADRAGGTLTQLTTDRCLTGDDARVIGAALTAITADPDPGTRRRAVRAGLERLAACRWDIGDRDSADVLAGLCPALSGAEESGELWSDLCDTVDDLAGLRRDGADVALAEWRPQYRDLGWHARIDGLDSELDVITRRATGEQ